MRLAAYPAPGLPAVDELLARPGQCQPPSLFPSEPVAAEQCYASPALSIQVECERDVTTAVSAARERGLTIRAVGARGSKNDCYSTEGISLELGRYDNVLAFDGERVTVQAGTSIGRLNEFLRQRGAIVPTCGEWQGGTVGGSIATGSHGGSARWGIHSNSVVSLRLVTADGTVAEISKDDPLFDHVAVSMGALGIISTITLACVPSFHLELETRVLPFDRYIREHSSLNGAAEFFAAVWFPAARRVLTFAANRVPPRDVTEPRMERFSVKTFLLDAASRYFDINVVSDRRLARRVVDHGDRILCPIPARSGRVRLLRAISRDWGEMEAAVPVPRAPDVLVALDRLVNDHRHAMLNAVGLRTSAQDNFSLSPCQQRDTFWIDLFFRGSDRAFTKAVGAAIENVQGRCHWGKHIGLPARYLRRQYPRMGEFLQTKALRDPDGTFCSPFTRRLGL